MPGSITFDPDPPIAGAKCKICKVGGTLPDVGLLTWDPATITQPEQVDWNTDNGGCVTINVPANATNVICESESGDAPFRDRPIAPPT